MKDEGVAATSKIKAVNVLPLTPHRKKVKVTDKMRLDWLSKMRLWRWWENVHYERKPGMSLRQAIDAAMRLKP